MLRPRSLSALAFIAFAVLVASIFSRKADEMVSGKARAIDGDSVIVEGRQMRLMGLDAPEIRQVCSVAGASVQCGRDAHRALQRALARGPAVCIGNQTDRYGRLLVICRVNGVDIGADLVRNGLAVDYGSYASEEREARAGYRGLWAGTFERPEDFRKRMREERAVAPGS